ncbi:efflux RND transporter periplasmic adaptor subunit [Roseibium sp. SCPC15]|uniref:efflux RND transporter periplasmic adaptor subunit n=1 Tax=Roseibium sp. SCP15 TaxID=3141376 RepID=UPI003337A2AA
MSIKSVLGIRTSHLAVLLACIEAISVFGLPGECWPKNAFSFAFVSPSFAQEETATPSEDEMPVREDERAFPLVRVTSVSATRESAEVTGYGIARAHYRQTPVAEVAGQVKFLSDRFEPGQKVRQGEVLLELEDVAYRSAVATARQNLMQAELTLLEEQQRAEQAKQDWERSKLGENPASELVLRKPQMEVEAAKVEAARAELELAESNLAKTRIVAPFDAMIISRSVTPSAFVSAGTAVGELYSLDRFDFSIPLSAKQWQSLRRDPGALDFGSLSARILLDGGTALSADVEGEDALVDESTRQRSLRLSIRDANAVPGNLKPGSFASVLISSNAVQDVLLVPAEVVTPNGFLWSVSPDNLLVRHSVTPAFRKGELVAIPRDQLKDVTSLRVVMSPLADYLPGQRVEPREATEATGDVVLSSIEKGDL